MLPVESAAPADRLAQQQQRRQQRQVRDGAVHQLGGEPPGDVGDGQPDQRADPEPDDHRQGPGAAAGGPRGDQGHRQRHRREQPGASVRLWGHRCLSTSVRHVTWELLSGSDGATELAVTRRAAELLKEQAPSFDGSRPSRVMAAKGCPCRPPARRFWMPARAGVVCWSIDATPTTFAARTLPPMGDHGQQVNSIQDTVAVAPWPGPRQARGRWARENATSDSTSSPAPGSTHQYRPVPQENQSVTPAALTSGVSTTDHAEADGVHQPASGQQRRIQIEPRRVMSRLILYGHVPGRIHHRSG
jgi:hypothetical protein